jgi:starvation-inducible DNA-binding protein
VKADDVFASYLNTSNFHWHVGGPDRVQTITAQLKILLAELIVSCGRKKMSNQNEVAKRREEPLRTPTFLSPDSVQNITAELNVLLADVFALYLKTKNFHWHVSGPHFRDYHLLLDEQGDQIFAMTDDIAERVRKLGGTTIRSIGHIARLKHVADNDAGYVEP